MNPDYKIVDITDVSRASSSASRVSRKSISANVDVKHKKIILDFLTKNGSVNGSITKTWKVPNSDSIGISTDSKQCIFVEREHKNNNTYFMIYNSNNETDFRIVFKCHDELCKNRTHLVYPK